MADRDPNTISWADYGFDKNEWRTPPDLFKGLDREFAFTLDAAATPENTLCDKFYTKQEDGLKQSWRKERVFINPPYSRGELKKWARKAWKASRYPETLVVGLFPAGRTEQGWFHDYVLKPRAELRWLRGRLQFISPSGRPLASAPFASVVIIWR